MYRILVNRQNSSELYWYKQNGKVWETPNITTVISVYTEVLRRYGQDNAKIVIIPEINVDVSIVEPDIPEPEVPETEIKVIPIQEVIIVNDGTDFSMKFVFHDNFVIIDYDDDLLQEFILLLADAGLDNFVLDLSGNFTATNTTGVPINDMFILPEGVLKVYDRVEQSIDNISEEKEIVVV